MKLPTGFGTDVSFTGGLGALLAGVFVEFGLSWALMVGGGVLLGTTLLALLLRRL